MPDLKSAPNALVDPTPTAIELRALLATLLADTSRTPRTRWLQLIGDVAVFPTALRPRCNWSVYPAGEDCEMDAIQKVVAVVARTHPYARQL